MKSKFLDLYNLVMEDINKELLYSKISDFLDNNELLPDYNDTEFYKKGIENLKNISNDDYEPLISGNKTIKIVPNGKNAGSILKVNDLKSLDFINIKNIQNNKNLNSIFYLLKYKKFKNKNYKIRIDEKSSLDSEKLQIDDISKKINDLDKNVLIKTPNGIKGPFDEVEKIEKTPKADVVMKSSSNDDKLFLSLKNGGKPGEFRQYGGKTDLANSDEDLLNKSSFVRKCYDLIKSLFNKMHEVNKNINEYDFKYLRNYIDDVNITQLAFEIPEIPEKEHDFFKKAIWGKDFPEMRHSSINNVDSIIDGNLTFTDFKENLDDKIDDEKDDKNETTINLKTLNGEFHQEWNPSLYNVKDDNDDLYKMCLVFIRYNANNEEKKTNRLNFYEFKNCRFQIYPKKQQIKNDIKKTKDLMEKFGLKENFNNLYN